jgi:hypothetical protein
MKPTDVAPEQFAGILWRLGAQVRDFEILVTDEGVCLRGRVSTYYAKQLAQHAVMNATRIPILANEIEVSSGVDPQGLG